MVVIPIFYLVKFVLNNIHRKLSSIITKMALMHKSSYHTAFLSVNLNVEP